MYFKQNGLCSLAPTLLASPPRPEQLAALKEILAGGQKAGEDGGGRFPVVLRLGGEGALHLLPPELWVGDVSAIEGSLDRGASLFILGLTRGKKEFPRRVFFERCGIRLAYRRGGMQWAMNKKVILWSGLWKRGDYHRFDAGRCNKIPPYRKT